MKLLRKTKLFLSPSGQAARGALLFTAAFAAVVLTFGLLTAPAIVFERPSGGGTSNVTLTDVTNVVLTVAPTNSGLTTVQLHSSLTSGTNSYAGDGTGLTNLPADTVTGTANQITVTASKNAVTGSTNYTLALANPLSLGQANIGTAWLTNVVTPTNAFGGTVVDFNVGDSQTNLGGGLTFTAVANVTAGAVNTCIIRLLSGGADRTIAFPANWHVSRGATSVVTNGFETDFLFTVIPGQRTNVAQLDYP